MKKGDHFVRVLRSVDPPAPERRSPLSLRGRRARTRWRANWRWTVGAIALASGGLAADIAVTEALDGTPTRSEQNLMAATAAGAIVLVPLGARWYFARTASEPWTTQRVTRRRNATWLVSVAVAVGTARSVHLSSRLVEHLRRDVDEPLTAIELGLEVGVSLTVFTSLIVIALRTRSMDTRRGRRRPAAGRRGTAAR